MSLLFSVRKKIFIEVLYERGEEKTEFASFCMLKMKHVFIRKKEPRR